MRLVAVLLCACLSPALAAVVTTLDGERLVGTSLSGDGRGWHLDGRRMVPGDLDAVRLREDPLPPRAWPTSQAGVLLADGSWLPVTALSAAAGDSVLAQSPLGALTLGLGTAVIGWGDAAWLDRPTPATDQVLLRDGGRLEGQVRGLDGRGLSVATALAPEPALVPLAQVIGLRLAVAPRQPAGVHLAGRSAIGRPPLFLAPAWPPRLTVDAQVRPDPAALPELQVRGGRRVALADLEPSRVEERGAFGVVWPWKRDANLDGSPVFVGGKRLDRAIVVHSEASLSWRLDGAYTRFTGFAGLSDLTAAVGDCSAALLRDGERVWERASVRGGAAEQISLDLTGAKELTLQVGLGARYDMGDHFVLGEAALLKR
jgi:hypothetical protein